MRAFALCDAGNHHTAITADLDRALQYLETSRTGKDSLVSLLSARAKIEYARGDFAAAMTGLEKAVRSDLGKATEFTNSGAVKPEKTAPVCAWTEPDMDALVQGFPADYRSHLFRGLYFSKFAPLDDESLKPALDSLRRSAELNPRSALPQLFKAKLLADHFVFQKRLKQLGWSDAARNRLDSEVVNEFDKALALDPTLLPALEGRALARFHLKRFAEAISDYNKIISRKPQDYATLHDRGLAKMGLGSHYDAILDFSAAIKVRPRELLQHSGYESRADAYMKTRQWDLAIRDLTTAISLQIGGSSLITNVVQFRAIYPEYKAASDEAIARKLHQTFYPDLKYEDFSERFFTGQAMPSTVIPDLYVKRSDAYLKANNWHRASTDFRRAVNGFPEYASALDRWREIGRTNSSYNHLDMKSFDDARRESITLWIKDVRTPEESEGPYTLMRFELNCSTTRLRMLSVASYDSSGTLTRSREGERWESIIPDSFGETLFNGACRKN
jgi:tetratricopeptide (TPR) repeat protein